MTTTPTNPPAPPPPASLAPAATGRDSAELQKLRLQIWNLRIVTAIAVCSAFAGAFAWVFSNRTSLVGPASIVIEVDDAFTKRLAEFRILNHKEETIYQGSGEDAQKMELSPGSYIVSAVVDRQEVYRASLALRAGERKTLRIVSPRFGNIRVSARTGRKVYAPGSVLDLAVDSSGNGFIWLFQRTTEGKYEKVFPVVTEQDNAITMERPFEFQNISVADVPGDENLLVIVTSAPSSTDAQELATRFTRTVVKAQAAPRDQNWGSAGVTYTVGLQSQAR